MGMRLKERYSSFEDSDSARRNLKVKKSLDDKLLVTESVKAFPHSILRTVEPVQKGRGEKTTS